VLKTIAITLASLVGALVVAFGALFFLAPNVLAKLLSDTGNHSASVYFYERQYLKSGELNDLALLINKLDQKTQGDKLELYSSEMVFAGGFKDFCDKKDEGKQLRVSSYEYYSGVYACSLAFNGKEEEALAFCKKFVNKNGYTENNPYRSVIADNVANKEFLKVIREVLLDLILNGFADEQIDIIVSDINDITNIIYNT
jgi:hypothetical protein